MSEKKQHHCECHKHEHSCGCHEEKHEHSCGCHEQEHDCGCGCGCGHDHGKESGLRDWMVPLVGLFCLLLVGLIPIPWGWLKTVLYAAIYLLVGHEVLIASVKHIVKGKIFDENFLMAVASLGAFLIGDSVEAIAVMIFYNLGEFCQNAAVRRSRRSVSQLMDIRPDHANLLVNGNEVRIDPAQAKVGDLLLIRPGEKIPLDCTGLEGSTTVDTAALTGESMPVECGIGAKLISGCINLTGVVKVRVDCTFAQSTVSRVLELMEESAAKKAKPERFISRFAKVYTPIVCGIALLTALLPSLLIGDPIKWIHTALTFLVISCPCALVISVPLSYVGGIGNASRHGILCKGSAAMELLPEMSDLVCDKTGTVTEGRFTVADIVSANGYTAQQLLQLAAAAEQHTTHPIGRSICEEAAKQGLTLAEVSDSKEISGKGIRCNMGGKVLLAGNAAFLAELGVTVDTVDGTAVHIAYDGRYCGHIRLEDRIRANAKETFASLHKMGICSQMLTGDSVENAKAVAQKIGIDGYEAKLLPQDKVTALERIMKKARGNTAFIGDGINDAPVLARADIGIAMGSIGSDAALEAADVVIMRDDLSKLPLAVKLAKQTRRIVYQNIIFALGVKVLVMVCGFFGYANMWLAVFADVGVALLAILNAVRPILSKKKE